MIKLKNGRLYFDGCDTTALAEEFKTPIYVFSHKGIVGKINELKECFTKPYPKNRIAYAAKAFFTLAMARILKNENICVDVVSGGELYTAIKGGIPPEMIEFNGNNKSLKEIQMAVDYGIGRIIVDSLQELDLIEEVCREKNTKIKVLYRITPGVKSDTHDYIVTGTKDSKFGVPLEDSILMPYIERGIKSDYVELLGVHFHLGSQILGGESYMEALEIMLNLVSKVKKNYNYQFTELNIGGGFGISYTDEAPLSYKEFLNPMMDRIVAFFNEHKMELPAVVVEPGRSIIAENGITLYTIGSIKDVPGIRRYASVDGGMGDNIRPALYGARYSAVLANKADFPLSDTVTISGKYCESGDIVIKDIPLPPVEKGDILAVLSTGAYGYSMANNYNRNPIPGAILIKDGKADWIIKPESYEDLIKNDVIPPSLD